MQHLFCKFSYRSFQYLENALTIIHSQINPAIFPIFANFHQDNGNQPQHDGVIIDMLDAYPFCDGSWSEGVPTPLEPSAWVSGQEQLLSVIRDSIPEEKWIIANAGCGFSKDSPFPQYLNGFLLENSLGAFCGLDMDKMLASVQRALESTNTPSYCRLCGRYG